MAQWSRECTDYTIRVIRAVMGETEVPSMPGNLALKALYRFAKLHNVEALIYHGLCRLEMDMGDPVWQDWENRAAMLLSQGIVQLAERDVLFEALTGGGIPLLPVKGCWIKEMYPNMEYRQMSDLDMLIPEDAVSHAREMMRSLGYTTDTFEDAPNHAGFLKPPYTEVELHTGLLERDGGYYDDVWQRAGKVEGYPCLYRFRAEDEYIYYIAHIHKHLEDAGIGIRSVLDSMVYRDVWPDMDWAYIGRELETLKLRELEQNIRKLCDCWFRTGEPVPPELEAVAEYMLSAGSYGTMENRSRKRLEKLDETYRNPLVRGAVYWRIQVCRPRAEMERSYPVLRKLPVLLPVFWIYRAVMRFVSRPKQIWHHVTLVFGRGRNDG